MMASGALPHSLYIHDTSATNGGQTFAGLNLGTINYAHSNNNNDNVSSQNKILNALPIAKDAPFNAYQRQHDPTCLPNTRTDLLCEIDNWIDREESPGIFWLSGLAGTGKSTIAQTVASQYNMKSRLAASFFFSRGGGDVSHAGKFITSIAFQMANSIPGLKSKVCDAIESHDNIASLSLVHQWQELVLVPLSNHDDQDCRPSYVIVVDALDECDSQDNIQIILRCLAAVHSLQGTPVRVLLTSRSEVHIQHEITQVRRDEHQDFVLHDIDPTIIAHDISIFLRHKLEITRNKYGLGDGWPAERDIKRLVEKSGGLFIWAATAWRFIDEDSQFAETRLLSLIHQTNDTLPPERKLDEIYTTVLTSSFQGNYSEAESQTLHTLFHEIVGPVVMLQDPLSLESLSELLGKDIAVLRRTVACLSSLLYVPADGLGTMQLLHPSFRDFIVDQRRCTNHLFHIDERSIHRKMYESCLRAISKHLHRDICNLRDPGALVAELSQVDLDRNIQSHVKYACRFWVYHCTRSDVNISSCSHVEAFFQKHFLYWLETLSLLGYGSNAVHMIHMLGDMFPDKQEADSPIVLKLREKIKKAFQTSPRLGASSVANSIAQPSLHDVIHDATRFVLAFRPMLDEAPLQLYCAGLLFSPKASIIREIFSSEASAWVLPWTHMAEIWSPFLQTLKSHVGAVSAVAFSPDSKTLALGFGDGTIQTWDSTSGKALQTIKSHLRFPISIIAFLPSGKTIASGSNYGTLQLWEVSTGKVLQTLHNSYSGRARAVAFSLDSKTIAWGFMDGTIETRGIRSSAQQTLRGHSVGVSALAFSPNGKTLASGCQNNEVKLWDVDSGEMLHMLPNSPESEGCVTALAFSPDSMMLASGFGDGTIKLWDADSGKTLQSLLGHLPSYEQGLMFRDVHLYQLRLPPFSVNALVFSPDSKTLASGSNDKTVRLWDTSSGTLLQTLKSHRGLVNAIAFSPKSNTLASGSSDTTVKLWDAGLRNSPHTRQGHPNKVNTLAFPSDRKKLAPGSSDATVKLWDAGSRNSPHTCQGHPDPVNALVFSPDSKTLASGSNDKTVRLWDTSSGKLLQTLKTHVSSVNALAFSPDSSTIVSGDKVVKLWDAGLGKKLQTIRRFSSRITAVAFSPDGKILAYGTSGRFVELWDIRSRTVLHTVESSLGSVIALAFSPDSKTLARGSDKEMVELWDISSSTALQTFKGQLSSVVNVIWPQSTSPLSLSVEGDWICRSERKVLWIPPEHRTSAVVFHDNFVGFAYPSGQIAILKYVV